METQNVPWTFRLRQVVFEHARLHHHRCCSCVPYLCSFSHLLSHMVRFIPKHFCSDVADSRATEPAFSTQTFTSYVCTNLAAKANGNIV